MKIMARNNVRKLLYAMQRNKGKTAMIGSGCLASVALVGCLMVKGCNYVIEQVATDTAEVLNSENRQDSTVVASSTDTSFTKETITEKKSPDESLQLRNDENIFLMSDQKIHFIVRDIQTKIIEGGIQNPSLERKIYEIGDTYNSLWYIAVQEDAIIVIDTNNIKGEYSFDGETTYSQK